MGRKRIVIDLASLLTLLASSVDIHWSNSGTKLVCMSSPNNITLIIKTHGSESRGQYSRTHAAINNDATTSYM